MKNLTKILSCLLLAALLFSLVACTGNGNPADTSGTDDSQGTGTGDGLYTVTVLDNENIPVSGASLMVSDGKSVFKTGTTGADGKATFDVTGEGLGVMIVNLPTGYDKPALPSGSAMHAMFGEEKALTLTVNKTTEETVTYTVKVVDQNGDAVVGAKLQLCPNGTCLPDDFVTDAKGEVTKELAPNLPIDVKVKELPSGYEKPAELDNGYHAKIEAGEVTITVTVTKN